MRRLLALTAVLFLTSAAVPRRGAEVHISFSGVICHIFDGQPRAVAMRGSGGMLHRATLHVPQSLIKASDVALQCDDGDCVLALDGVALRFPGSGRAHYDAGGSFDTIVPHLSRVTNGEMHALRDDLSDVVSASMELPAGNLTATALAARAHYDPDFEHRGERQFAREVFLDGVVPSPRLMVRGFGERAWRGITFRDGVLIELRMVNDPAADAMPMGHEVLFYDLASTPLATRPVIVQSAAPRDGTSTSCSVTTYP
jgi:hypothetical protein